MSTTVERIPRQPVQSVECYAWCERDAIAGVSSETPDSNWVCGMAWHHGPTPVIEISRGELGGIRISVEEARQIAARILEVADEMEAA